MKSQYVSALIIVLTLLYFGVDFIVRRVSVQPNSYYTCTELVTVIVSQYNIQINSALSFFIYCNLYICAFVKHIVTMILKLLKLHHEIVHILFLTEINTKYIFCK